MSQFEEFPKIPRLKRNCVITEKIDGTNAQVYITEGGEYELGGGDSVVPEPQILAGSRNRYVTPEADNYGFAKWVAANREELLKLGPGRHFGEWWGLGIQRGYGLKEKRFSLFNVGRWKDAELPKCCSLVPVLYEGIFCDAVIEERLHALRKNGSYAAPGFKNPEGIVVYHEAARSMFKVTLERDEEPKGKR